MQKQDVKGVTGSRRGVFLTPDPRPLTPDHEPLDQNQGQFVADP